MWSINEYQRLLELSTEILQRTGSDPEDFANINARSAEILALFDTEEKKYTTGRRGSTKPLECQSCSATETPEWRRGPLGPRTLCNACGLVYSKLLKQQQTAGRKQLTDSSSSSESLASIATAGSVNARTKVSVSDLLL